MRGIVVNDYSLRHIKVSFSFLDKKYIISIIRLIIKYILIIKLFKDINIIDILFYRLKNLICINLFFYRWTEYLKKQE